MYLSKNKVCVCVCVCVRVYVRIMYVCIITCRRERKKSIKFYPLHNITEIQANVVEMKAQHTHRDTLQKFLQTHKYSI
jgi:hypothetical protein